MRAAVGPDDRITFSDMSEVGRNPRPHLTLGILDRHHLEALDRMARGQRRRIALRDGATILVRLAELLDLTNVVVT